MIMLHFHLTRELLIFYPPPSPFSTYRGHYCHMCFALTSVTQTIAFVSLLLYQFDDVHDHLDSIPGPRPNLDAWNTFRSQMIHTREILGQEQVASLQELHPIALPAARGRCRTR